MYYTGLLLVLVFGDMPLRVFTLGLGAVGWPLAALWWFDFPWVALRSTADNDQPEE